MSHGPWTSEDYWASFRSSRDKAKFWEDRARGHLKRKKPCEACAKDQELYGETGCSIFHDSWMKSEEWSASAGSARVAAQKAEKREGKPITVDGVRTVEQVRRENDEEMERRSAAWQAEEEATWEMKER